MLEGLKRLEKRGDFSVNPSPVETKRMWMEFGDSISRFLWEVCEITRDVNEDVVPKDDLYEHYLNWTEDRMEEKITEQKFYYRINDNPLITTSRKRINGVQKRCVCGLKVKKEELYGEKID